MGAVDTIMVGRLPNSAIAIGATGLGETLYNMLAIFAAGLLLGMDTFVAQAFGREDIKDARHTLINGLFLALLITPLLMLFVLGWPPLMRQFGISPELVGPMTPFLRALNWGSGPLLIYFRPASLLAIGERGASHHVRVGIGQHQSTSSETGP